MKKEFPKAKDYAALIRNIYGLDLRPITTMTNEEAEHLAFLCMNESYYMSKEEFVSKEEIDFELVLNDGGCMLDDDILVYIVINCRYWDGGLAIRKDGSISLADEEGTVERPLPSVTEKVLYLISCGFDMFDLKTHWQEED